MLDDQHNNGLACRWLKGAKERWWKCTTIGLALLPAVWSWEAQNVAAGVGTREEAQGQ